MSNQKIDGVSRRMLTELLCHVSKLENRALVDELRALLAKPTKQQEPQEVGVVNVVDDGYSTCYTGVMFAQAIIHGTIKDGDKLYVIKDSPDQLTTETQKALYDIIAKLPDAKAELENLGKSKPLLGFDYPTKKLFVKPENQ